MLRMRVRVLRINDVLKTKMVKNLAREVALLDVSDEDSEDLAVNQSSLHILEFLIALQRRDLAHCLTILNYPLQSSKYWQSSKCRLFTAIRRGRQGGINSRFVHRKIGAI